MLINKMLHIGFLGVSALALAACGTEGPTEVDGSESPTTAIEETLDATHGNGVIESASGGAKYTLTGIDFDGDGVPDPLKQKLDFTAHEKADGTVGGRILYEQEIFGQTFRLEADVTCLGVYDGKRAKYGGPIVDSNVDLGFPPGTTMWLHSIDHGEGAGSPPDETTGIGVGSEEENQAFCDSPAPPTERFLADVTEGNIQVHD